MMKKLKFPYMTDIHRNLFATAILFGACGLALALKTEPEKP